MTPEEKADKAKQAARDLHDMPSEPRNEPSAPPGATRLLTASEIFAPLPPINWMCQALDFAPGAPFLFAGYGFSGKTIAAQGFALAETTGTKVWGRFDVRRAGRVLHLDWEQGEYLTRFRYQRLARGSGIDPRALEGRLVVAPFPGWCLDSDMADELTRLCSGYDLVIIDSFKAACPHTEENAAEARIPLDRLTRISEITGAVFGVLLHARKPSPNTKGGARYSIRGSGALYDASGSVLVFSGEKGEAPLVEHEKARITGLTHPDFRLHIEDVEMDGDPRAGLRVSYIEVSASGTGDSREAKVAAKFTKLKERVLDLIRKAGTYKGGVNDIECALEVSKDGSVSAVLKALVREGKLEKGGTYHEPTFTVLGGDRAEE